MVNKSSRYANGAPSVTEIINTVMRKPGLEYWFKNHTAEWCDKESAKSKEIGDVFHEFMHAIAENRKIKLTTPYLDEIKNLINSFRLFRIDHPEFIFKNAEIEMYDDTNKFNGRLDILSLCFQILGITDWKTGKCKKAKRPPIYVEYLVQVAAYAHLYEYTHPKEKIKKCYVVVFAKDKVAYNLISISQAQIAKLYTGIFLPALSIYYTQQRAEKYIKEHNGQLK